MSALRPVNYPGSGNYLMAGSQKICRYDEMTFYFWDHRNGCEIPVSRTTFEALTRMRPRMTAAPLELRELGR